VIGLSLRVSCSHCWRSGGREKNHWSVIKQTTDAATAVDCWHNDDWCSRREDNATLYWLDHHNNRYTI
jgi:hypothetical protein